LERRKGKPSLLKTAGKTSPLTQITKKRLFNEDQLFETQGKPKTTCAQKTRTEKKTESDEDYPMVAFKGGKNIGNGSGRTWESLRLQRD